MNRRSFNIVITLLIGTLLTVSAFAVSLNDNPGLEELANNKEYQALRERSKQLSVKADSINTHLAQRRKMLDQDDVADIETLRAEIIILEQQSHDIAIEQGIVTRKIGGMEQDVIMNNILSQQQHTVVGEVIDDSSDDQATTKTVPYLIDNECFKRELSASEYTELQKAQEQEIELLKLTESYTTAYNRLVEVANSYSKADRASVANPLYDEYEKLSAELTKLDSKIHDTWNHILDTKYFALAYILEKEHRYDILDRASANYQTMQQTCAEKDGAYASDGLMRYAIGRRTLLSYEIEFARDMRLKPAQDSLRSVLEQYKQPYYSIKPIKVEFREFMDFAPVKIGRTNFYDENNPLPELQVYERGTIYRILLGKYRTKQTMTLFKGVQPMSIARDDDGIYHYYAGGYAKESEARDALQFLKDKGFKAPELCRWKDGEMTIITSAKPEVEEQVEAKIEYMVIIKCAELDSSMRQIISQEAPGKVVSRSGGSYAIGMFSERGEADTLLTALTDAYPNLEIKISETVVE